MGVPQASNPEGLPTESEAALLTELARRVDKGCVVVSGVDDDPAVKAVKAGAKRRVRTVEAAGLFGDADGWQEPVGLLWIDGGRQFGIDFTVRLWQPWLVEGAIVVFPADEASTVGEPIAQVGRIRAVRIVR